MVWVYIALSILLFFLLFLSLIRFRFSIDVQTPLTLKGSVGFSFLRFKKEVIIDAVRAVFGDDVDDEDDEEYGFAATKVEPAVAAAYVPPINDGQRGAVQLPDSWWVGLTKFQKRVRKTFIKWALDFGVWRILFRFSLRSGRRVLRLFHPVIKSMQLGLEDVYDLGRIAAAWAVIAATIPGKNIPVEFKFNEPFSFRATLVGGFTALDAFFFGIRTFFTFPWIPLGLRFLECWREPRLNRWQRRVLLP